MTVTPGQIFRLPPQNLDAERGALGGILLDNTAMHELSRWLVAEDFFRDAHQVVYRIIQALYDRGSPIDVITVANELELSGEFKAIGGDETLAEIANSVPHGANAVYHASIVRELSVKRRLIDAATATLEDCYSGTLTADEATEAAEVRVFAIGESSATQDTQYLGELVDEAMERFSRRNEGEYSGVSTGLTDLDETTDGFANGSLVILAARPSMGKTALATQIAEYAAIASKLSCLFVSLEMAGIEIAERLLVARSRVDGHRARTGNLEVKHMHDLGRAYDELRTVQTLAIDDSPLRTVSQIAANARRHKARHGLGLVVVDYLQLIAAGSDVSHRASRQEQVAAISRRLKCLAKELGVPLVALSQLNRASEGREDRRPRLADLRDSGAIEQDADMVLLLHRPEFYDPDDEPGIAELIVAKNRNGATATLKFVFLKHIARFEDFHRERFGDVPAF